jgi:hypothetical protein
MSYHELSGMLPLAVGLSAALNAPSIAETFHTADLGPRHPGRVQMRSAYLALRSYSRANDFERATSCVANPLELSPNLIPLAKGCGAGNYARVQVKQI